MTQKATPPGWTWTTLGALLERIEAGHSPKTEGRPCRAGERGVLKVSAVSWRDFRAEENKVLPPSYRFDETRAVRKNDLLISRANTVELVGAVVHVKSDHPNLMLSDKTLRLVPKADTVAPEFLMYALRMPWVRELFEEDATGTSDSMRNLSQEKIRSAPVLLAPFREQQRIVAKLDGLLARSRRAKEALDSFPELVERYRQSVLASAFRGDLTQDWRGKNSDVEPASDLLERIRTVRRQRWEEAELERIRSKGRTPSDDRWRLGYPEPVALGVEELPPLPKSWVWVSVDEISEIAGGLTKNGSKRQKAAIRVPLASVAAVQLRRIDPGAIGSIGLLPEDGDRGLLRKNDLLIVEGNGSLAHIGRVALWDFDLEGARHQNHIIRLRPFVFSPQFLLEWLASPEGRAAIIGEATSATGLYTLSLSKVGRLPVPLPPLAEQEVILQRIAASFRPIGRTREAVSKANAQMAALDAALLAKAFRGELVPQDPTDEPASLLLERLRADQAPASEPRRDAKARRNPQPERVA